MADAGAKVSSAAALRLDAMPDTNLWSFIVVSSWCFLGVSFCLLAVREGPDAVRGLENAPAVGKAARFEDQRQQNANAENDVAGGENEPAAEIGECRQQGATKCVKGFLDGRDESRSEDRAERRA